MRRFPVAALIAICLIAGVIDAASRPLRVCHIPVQSISNDRIFARHALFATRYLAPRFPRLNVSFDYATTNGGPSIQDVALGLLSPRARACDALIGPQWSSVAVGISALVNVPWVSHTATSTALSDKNQHPWFSRMLPTDDFGGAGMAAVAQAFGWTHASAICVDDAYGQSLLSGFRKRHAANGGTLEQSPCVLKDAGADAVAAVVADVRRAAGRVVVVAGASSAAVLGLIVDAAVALGMHRTHAFIFSESPCAARWARLRDLPGAFCVSYTSDAAVTAPYDAAWAAHDPAALFGHLPALGIPAPADPYAGGLYAYLIHDCVLALLHAFNATATDAGIVDTATLPPTSASQPTSGAAAASASAAALSTLRSQVVPEGATGSVAMDANGDRVGALIVLMNVVPDHGAADGFALEGFANWSPRRSLEITDERDRYWLANARGPPPGSLQPPPPAASNVPSVVLLMALLAAVIVIGAGFAVIMKLGCSDANVVAQVFHSGAAGAAGIATLDLADIVLSCFAAVEVFTSDDQYSETFRFTFASLCVVAAFAGVVDLGMVAVFLRAAFRAGFNLTPGQKALWHTRLAVGATFSLAFEDLPMLAVSLAGLSLSNAGGRETPGLLLATFIVNSVVCGAKLGEPMAILSHALRAKPVELHRRINEKFARVVPLTMTSQDRHVRAVARFIAKDKPKRMYVLQQAAKHIVVECQRDYVDSKEFFAVVWVATARMFTATAAAAAATLHGTNDGQHTGPEALLFSFEDPDANNAADVVAASTNITNRKVAHQRRLATSVATPSSSFAPDFIIALQPGTAPGQSSPVRVAFADDSEASATSTVMFAGLPQPAVIGAFDDDDDFDDEDEFQDVRIIGGIAMPVSARSGNGSSSHGSTHGLSPSAVELTARSADDNNPLSPSSGGLDVRHDNSGANATGDLLLRSATDCDLEM